MRARREVSTRQTHAMRAAVLAGLSGASTLTPHSPSPPRAVNANTSTVNLVRAFCYRFLCLSAAGLSHVTITVTETPRNEPEPARQFEMTQRRRARPAWV